MEAAEGVKPKFILMIFSPYRDLYTHPPGMRKAHAKGERQSPTPGNPNGRASCLRRETLLQHWSHRLQRWTHRVTILHQFTNKSVDNISKSRFHTLLMQNDYVQTDFFRFFLKNLSLNS
jgi:hypothetical protein